MNEDRVSNITPSEEDPVVDRWLNSLPELVPNPGFEDAVMARVWRPAPSWLQSMQSATRALFSGKRVWMWAGGLAASSAVSMVILVGLAVSHWVQVETAWSVFFDGFVAEAWRVTATVTAQAIASGLAMIEFWGVTSTMLMSASIAGALITVLSAYGLYKIMSNNTERISYHASR